MFKERVPLLEAIEKSRSSRVILYVTGDRQQMETQIGKDALDLLVHHLDLIEHAEKITLYLYTNGGDVIASWSIANLIRQFCDEFEVIVSAKALSGGTLICLGANIIVMTKQAVLGPIDPSTNSPLNPQVPGAPPHARAPISVEAVTGYLDFARHTLGKRADLKEVLVQLAGSIHPHVLGQAFRSRSQIRMLAKKLLRTHPTQKIDCDKVLQFLCSESGSHDYTITRQEARDSLGLPVERPDATLYDQIRSVQQDFTKELELRSAYDPNLHLAGTNAAPYSFKRALIESIQGGTHAFISEGTLTRQPVQLQPGVVQHAINDNRSFEGWRHFPQ
jgi:Serine dehydrogenase proteinase